MPAGGDGGHLEGVAYQCAAAMDVGGSGHGSAPVPGPPRGLLLRVADETEFRHCCNRGGARSVSPMPLIVFKSRLALCNSSR